MRRLITALAVLPVLATAVGVPAAARAATGDRIDLTVLLVSDGGTGTGALAAELPLEGVPTVTVDLNAPDRPTLDAAFLGDPAGIHARFESVILPNATPAGLSAAEMTALAAYEQRFGIRQLDAYVYPGA